MARPAFKPTAKQRTEVAIAAGAGMAHEAIAVVIGVSRNTLEKHFENELSSGAYRRRFDALQGIYKAAKKGNVSAAKAYLAGQPVFVPPQADGMDKPAARAPRLGKKEAADAAAVTAQVGTGWEGLLPGAAPLQ